MRADILSRKDQVNTIDDNKDIKMLKNELWTRWVNIKEVIVLRENQAVEETTLLDNIRKNQTKE